MRTRIIAVIAVFGVLLTAGIASANGDDTDIASANGDDTDSRVDTLFTYGYDAQTQLFFANTHATDATQLDCTLTGTLSAVYEYSDKVSFGAESLSIKTDRFSWQYYGLDTTRTEKQYQLSIRLRFGN